MPHTTVLAMADAPLVPRPPEYLPPADVARRIDARIARLTAVLGLQHLGASLVAVPPGRQAFPFHSHRHNDELFVILQGEGELRLGSTRRAIQAGDLVSCPAGGPETAHAITNTGPGELRYLALSSQFSPEVCEYPDSGKVGIYEDRPPAGAEPFLMLAKAGTMVDYWDGE